MASKKNPPKSRAEIIENELSKMQKQHEMENAHVKTFEFPPLEKVSGLSTIPQKSKVDLMQENLDKYLPDLNSVVNSLKWGKKSHYCFFCNKESKFGKHYSIVIGKIIDYKKRGPDRAMEIIQNIRLIKTWTYTPLAEIQIMLCPKCSILRQRDLYSTIELNLCSSVYVPEAGADIVSPPKNVDILVDETNGKVIKVWHSGASE